jgi:hypothetical protein
MNRGSLYEGPDSQLGPPTPDLVTEVTFTFPISGVQFLY